MFCLSSLLPILLSVHNGCLLPFADRYHFLIQKPPSSIIGQKKIIYVDVKNVFNCLDRSKMFSASYQFASDLHFEDSVISSSQGIRQGDPLGPFLYSLTTLPILSWLNFLPGTSCVAYVDDTYIIIDDSVDADDLLSQ
ncbi:hypothetical protein GEMRC1_005304 [Eukaryota sp. GEM-RC1]